jgi:hypothetical protein
MSGKIFTPALIHELEIRGIKIIDIVYVTIINFLIGYYTTVGLDKLNSIIFGEIEEGVEYSKTKIMFDVLFQMALTGIVLYIETNIVASIPFPLNGVAGFDHSKLSELAGRSLLAVFLITFQKNLQSKIRYLQSTE